MLEVLKVIILGIVQGITEWLPISSTGHLILVEQLIQLKQKREKATDKADAKYGFGLDKANKPVIVKKGDTVEYTIRIYNEGKEDGKAEEDDNSVMD